MNMFVEESLTVFLGNVMAFCKRFNSETWRDDAFCTISEAENKM